MSAPTCPVCHEPLAGKVTETRLPCRPGRRPAYRVGHERADGRWCAHVDGGPVDNGATIPTSDADARQTAASDHLSH